MTIRVVIAHRSGVVRDALRLLAVPHDIVVVGEARDGSALLELCATERPDVVITEADFEDGTDIDSCLPRLVATGARVGVLADDAGPAHVIDAIAILAGRPA
jgi:DNA-binding NarL/FixJ family response regulator